MHHQIVSLVKGFIPYLLMNVKAKMKRDVINALSGIIPEKIPSKETLNHPELMKYVSGIDPFGCERSLGWHV